jgi:Ca2+/H+ antiporter
MHLLNAAGGQTHFEDAQSEDGSETSITTTSSSSSCKGDRPAWQTLLLAVAKFLLGAVLCLGFADPLVGSVGDLSRATGIPGFFIAFVAAPLASNASELVSSLKFALGKRSRNISVTFNQVRETVRTVSAWDNTCCLNCCGYVLKIAVCVFLGVV